MFMNAEPVLHQIAAALQECHLEAILIGNAAAALQAVPVTTLDFDFMFRKTPANLKKTENAGCPSSRPINEIFLSSVGSLPVDG